MSFEADLVSALPAVRAFSRRLIRDHHDAEDLVQDALASALGSRSGFDGENLRAWLFTILKNRAINWHKKKEHRRQSEERVSSSSCGVWASMRPLSPDSGADGEEVRRALSELSPDHRDILLSLGLDGMSYEEIAGDIGRPIGTVMSRVHRARKSFAGAYR